MNDQPLLIRHHDETARRLLDVSASPFLNRLSKTKLNRKVSVFNVITFCGSQATEYLDPVQIEKHMARLHPACSSIQFRGQRGQGAPWRRKIRQDLEHLCADGEKTAKHTHTHTSSATFTSHTCAAGALDAASWREVERFFHQSVFESMPLTRLNQDGVLERSSTLLGAPEAARQHTVLPWDEPLSFANLQLKNKQARGHFLCQAPCRPGAGEP